MKTEKIKALQARERRAVELPQEVRQAHEESFHLTREPLKRGRGLALMDSIDAFLRAPEEEDPTS